MSTFKKMAKCVIKIFSDGGARGNPGPAASAFVVMENGVTVYKKGKFLGVTTNNVAEYTAVLMAVDWLLKNRNEKNILVHHFLDSELVANQLTGRYKVKSKKLLPIFLQVKNILKKYNGDIKYVAVKRESNRISDALVNETLDENS